MEFADGTPCWADATLPDVETGKRFYGDLFGWTFDEGAGAEYGYYTQAYADGRNVAALAPTRDGGPAGWTVHFTSRDAEAGARAVRDAGGHLLTEPLSVGPFGTLALAADPEGAVFGLWQAGTHTGFEALGEPATFHRAELHTRDRATAAPFYASVLGPGAARLTVTGTDGGAPAGLTGTDDGAPAGLTVTGTDDGAPARFLLHFGVDDCAAAAEAATRLGGHVHQGPFDAAHGRVAVLADDQGAAFAVVQG